MAKFVGNIQLQIIPGDADDWLVAEPFSYITADAEEIKIEAGLKTDLASTPRIVWNIFPPFGLYTGAAIVHDNLYTKGMFNRKKCDGILLEAMEVEGVSWLSRWTIYSQVRLWGWVAWGQHQKALLAATRKN